MYFTQMKMSNISYLNVTNLNISRDDFYDNILKLAENLKWLSEEDKLIFILDLKCEQYLVKSENIKCGINVAINFIKQMYMVRSKP